MSKNTMDRRVSRTRTMLQQGLCTLLRKKRYEAITIGDICSAANVGRSTFYAHYRTKDDLKRSGLESFHSVLAERQRAARRNLSEIRRTSFDFSLSVFSHAREHLDHYRTLAGSRGGKVSLAKVRDMVTDLVRHEIAAPENKHSTDPIAREAAIQYVVGAYMSLLTWWLDSGAKLPPEKIDAIFRRLTTQGFAG